MNGRAILMLAVAMAGVSPAGAQVRVILDGSVQDVPAGVIRTISARSGQPPRIVDQPFSGAAVPGAATITTTETDDEDEDGTILSSTVITRIEPIAAAALPAGAIVLNDAPLPPGEAAGGYASGSEPALPAVPVSYAPPPSPVQPAVLAAEPGRPLRVRRDAMTGHFILPVRINGVTVHAIVDTGAATTILSARDARATGADRAVVRSEPMAGIGGLTRLAVARLSSMEVAGAELGSFEAAIGADGIPYTLLGQTELARLGRILIEDGTLTITPRPTQLAAR